MSALHAQTCNLIVTLSANPNSISAGQTSTLQALVSPCATNKQVRFDFSPVVAGAVVGTPSLPDAGGLSTVTYTAPALVSTTIKVTVTAVSLQDNSKTDTSTLTINQPAIDVGSGAPTPTMQNQFINSFFRNGFFNLVSLPPVGRVRTFGTGYVQEFNDALKSGAKLALVTASPSAPSSGGDTANPGVVQLLADLYGYYATVGAATAGLPLYDTQRCPSFADNSCTYDIFDKNYALFAYDSALAAGQDFTIRNTFFTEWTARLGIAGLGRPVEAETSVTASTKTTATEQAFTNGAIYVISSGVNNAKPFTVLTPIYNLYVSSGGPGGPLGLPVSAELTLSSGVHQQKFEGGTLEFTPGSDPTQRFPVASIAITGAQTGITISLNLGDNLTLTATPMSAAGTALPDRPVSWTTTNSRVISIEATGHSAVLHAGGGGVATVSATSEGIVSPKLNFLVVAPCCQVGDGAPTAVQRAFQDALTRNRISVQLPVAGPAVRVGGGYLQTVQSADGGSTYWLAQSDKIGSAYVVGGAILDQYDAMGGPAGTFGYPITDRSAGGTQRFENGAALAGNPVRLVTGGVLTKWALLGYETGSVGAPVGDAAPFDTFGANAGAAQSFAAGSIYAATQGPRAGQSYIVTGLILARYTALGGAGGDFGMPVSDEFVTSGVHQQNFEGGNFTWAAGDSVAKETALPKTPGVIASPATLTAGGRARVAIVGFASGSTLRVSVTGQPDFTVTAASGAYSWEIFFPLSTRSGLLTIKATDTKTSATASGAVTVKGFDTNRVGIAKVQGDGQTGVPGALLPLALRVALRDAAGDPVTGAAVNFVAFGASVLTANAVTDATGQAQTYVRVQSQEGTPQVNVTAPGVASSPVTFNLRSSGATLANFPKLQQAGSTILGNGTATIAQKGALLTAVASILRYHQNRSELPGPNGPADPIALNTFLKGYCPPDSKGAPNCDGFLANPDSGEQVVNLWRAADFTGGADVEVANPTPAAVADLVADGSPALLSLGLSRNGTLSGGHYVVAIGIAGDGSIVIQDPSPQFGRANLNEYLNGFTLGADRWQADLRGVMRFALNSPGATRFLVGALSQSPALLSTLALDVSSVAGSCGRPLDLLDAVDPGVPAASQGALLSRLSVCEGSQATYQLQVGPLSTGTPQRFRALVDDLAAGGSLMDLSGSAAATYKVTRPKLNLTVAAQDVSFAANAVVGGATFTPGIAPGGVVSIFGSGLSGVGKATTVDIDGVVMKVYFATAFQVNAEVPLGVTPGGHTLRVQSAFGTLQQPVTVAAVAPGIFLLGSPPAGAITNAAFSLIGPTNPLVRGQTLIVFATGLGAVRARGNLQETVAAVTAVVNGVELPVAYAGLASGYTGGLYQVNVLIPASTPPGLGIPLALKIGGQLSNSVVLALQ